MQGNRNGSRFFSSVQATAFLLAGMSVFVASTAPGQDFFVPYAPQPYIAVDDEPNAIISGQFLGDATLDLAIVNVQDASVQLLLGSGAMFYVAQTVECPEVPRFIAAGDFDLNGVLEIVTSNNADNSVTIYARWEDGLYHLFDQFGVGEGPWDLAVARLNGDDYPDLVVANGWDTTLSCFFGSPNGISALRTFECGYGPGSVLPADFDGDGDVELAVLREDDGLLAYMENDGNGNFSVSASYIVGEVGSDLKGGAVADLDGDEDLDLALVTNSLPAEDPDFISIMLNNGAGVFALLQTYAMGSLPTQILAQDLNGDEIPDLAATAFSSGSVDLFFGLGGAVFHHMASYPVGAGARDLEAIDIDQDGDGDLAVVLRQIDRVVFLENRTEIGTGAEQAGIAAHLVLTAAPNPFNPSTVIQYQAPAGSLQIAVFDASGGRVRTLLAARTDGGAGSLVWDGRTDDGQALPSGIYLLRLAAGEDAITRKLALMK
jgi:hypothetical protein